MKLIDEPDLGAPDPGALNIGQMRSGNRIEVNFPGVGVFEQSGNMQERRFAGAGWRDERDRLAGPDREFGAFKDVEGRIALMELPAYAVQKDERVFFFLGCRAHRLAYGGFIVHLA